MPFLLTNELRFTFQRGKQLFSPTPAWTSAVKTTDTSRSASIMTIDSTGIGPYDNVGYIM